MASIWGKGKLYLWLLMTFSILHVSFCGAFFVSMEISKDFINFKALPVLFFNFSAICLAIQVAKDARFSVFWSKSHLDSQLVQNSKIILKILNEKYSSRQVNTKNHFKNIFSSVTSLMSLMHFFLFGAFGN